MNKRAAFEMSMSTIIIIVLSVVFLILGLVLIRNIYGVADDSINSIDQQLMKEIEKMFTDEGGNVVVYLGSDRIAKIRADTTNFGIGIGAQTKFGGSIAKRSDMQYSLELDKSSATNCLKKNGVAVTRWFTQRLSDSQANPIYNDIEDFDSSNGFARIELTIPAGTKICTQKVFVTFKDNTDVTLAESERIVGGTSFTIEVLRKGLF